MKLFMNGILLLLAALLLPKSEAESSYYRDPAHPGKCVVGPNLILSPGESASLDCNYFKCEEDGKIQITIRACNN